MWGMGPGRQPYLSPFTVTVGRDVSPKGLSVSVHGERRDWSGERNL